jgi:hypothetical protein
MKKIDILDACNIWNNINSFDMKKMEKSKTCHRNNEEKGEFETLGLSL